MALLAGLLWLTVRLIAGSCERSNDHHCSIKGTTFLDKVSDYHLLNHDSALIMKLVKEELDI
jgi:hypothetical protein